MPIHFCFSYDDEVGCIGVRSLVTHVRHLPHKPRLCVVGEPTGMKVVIGHKGKLAVRCSAKGLACHSSLAPHGVNAAEYAAEVIVRLRQLARQNSTHRVAYGTEAGIFQRDAGVPTVICGPGFIAQAHKPSEFCEIDQLRKCEAFMARLAKLASGG